MKIFLADDHALVREGIRNLIESQADMQVVGEAEDGEDAWNAVRQLCRKNVPSDPTLCATPSSAIDIVVMDISMPNVNGVEATEAIRQAYPNIKVITLSMHEDKGYLRELLKAGATGYVLKRSASVELIHAIRLVAAGKSYIDPGLSSKVMESIEAPPPDDLRLPKEVEGVALSQREADVLRYIAQGFRNTEIAAHFELSVKSIETYKARGMEKLGFKRRTEVVHYALEHGWLKTN